MSMQLREATNSVPAPVAMPHGEQKRISHLVLTVTRYASLEPASLDAAIRDGLAELLPSLDRTAVSQASEIYVYFRNRHGVTVTLEIGIPIAHIDDLQVAGTVRRRQKSCRMTLRPAPNAGAIAAAMDRAVVELGVSDRLSLPECWQTFSLPYHGYEVTAPMHFGLVRNHRSGS